MKTVQERLTAKKIESITRKAKRSKKVPLLVSKPVQIALDEDLNSKIEVLSTAQGMPSNQFVAMLLKEDVERLWQIYKSLS